MPARLPSSKLNFPVPSLLICKVHTCGCLPPVSAPDVRTRPIYLSPSSSVFSRLRSMTSPMVLANLCGEWGTPAGRRNICSGGDKVLASLQCPPGTWLPAVSWPPQPAHGVRQPPSLLASSPEAEEMSGLVRMGSSQEEVPKDQEGRQDKPGRTHSNQSQHEWTMGSCSLVLHLPMPWGPGSPLPAEWSRPGVSLAPGLGEPCRPLAGKTPVGQEGRQAQPLPPPSCRSLA